MQLKYFTIQFKSPSSKRVYLVGNTVEGVVKIGFEKPTEIKSINVLVQGKAKAGWDKDEAGDTVCYIAYEYYIQKNIKLYGVNTGTIKHPAGNFTYPFSVKLGKDIPSSYEGKRGYVRYSCTATVEKSKKFDQGIKHVKEPFNVIRPYDCNIIPNALKPIVETQDRRVKGVFCMCTQTGSMSVRLKVNKTAFVPGEPLAYEINIENRSKKAIREMDFILRQNSTFVGYSDKESSSGKPHYHTKKASFILYNGKIDVPVNEDRTYKGASTIPPLPPSKLEGCNIIEIQYNVILRVQNRWAPIKMKKEICIGTIPANSESDKTVSPTDVDLLSPESKESFLGFAEASSTTGEALATTIIDKLNEYGIVTRAMRGQGYDGAANIAESPPPSYNTLTSPPSYAECIFGKVNIKENNGIKPSTERWAPAYTYYHWNEDTVCEDIKQVVVTPADSSYNEI